MLRQPIRLSTVLATLAVVAAPAVLAQGSGMVSVELTGVSDSLAQRMGVDPARMPMSILVPVDVAAAACSVRPESLSVTRGGGGCTASSPVAQLEPILRDRMRQDEAMGGPPAKSTPDINKPSPAEIDKRTPRGTRP